jgi:septum formation protein
MNLSKEKNRPLILASSSPRRREICENLKILFQVDSARDFQELSQGVTRELVLKNAQGKAKEVAHRHSTGLILGVDTLGELSGQIFEKPKNDEDAFQMLQKLQGQTHSVFSGLYLIDAESGHAESAIEETRVTFAPLTDDEIREYLAWGEHSDKAAAYAVQGHAALFITKIEGDYWNVVGLPVARLREIALRFGVDLLQSGLN